MVRNLPAMQETWVQSLGQEDLQENGIHSHILAWKIPWTEEPGGLQSTGSQRVGHDRVTKEGEKAIKEEKIQAIIWETGMMDGGVVGGKVARDRERGHDRCSRGPFTERDGLSLRHFFLHLIQYKQTEH